MKITIEADPKEIAELVSAITNTAKNEEFVPCDSNGICPDTGEHTTCQASKN